MGDCVSPAHLARFIVDVLAVLDLTARSARYGPRGAPAYAPARWRGLLCAGSSTGVCRTRQRAQATDESWPFRFIAGAMPPDPDPLAHVRHTLLPASTALVAQVLLRAYAAGGLTLGARRLEGTQRHAAAAKRKAVRSPRRRAREAPRRQAVEDGMALGGRAAQGAPGPEGLVSSAAIVRRQAPRTSLAAATAVRAARAEARDSADPLAEEAPRRAREATARTTGHTPRGRPPAPPPPGARPTEPSHCTDPAAQRRQTSTHPGFDQHDTAHIATAQASLWIVGHALAPHAPDQAAGAPTCEALPPAVGAPPAAAVDNGYCSEAPIERFAARGIEPDMATGRDAHDPSGRARFGQTPVPPLDDASPQVTMAATRRTAIGQASSRVRTGTVEPVCGIITETLGFRQCSLRGLTAAAGEWGLGCLACNLQRLHTLSNGQSCSLMISPTGC